MRSPATENVANELVFTRVFDAPREIVFEAWTEPDQIGNWWGPRGFTTKTNVTEVKVGRRWDHVMHGPDGTDYSNGNVYSEVVRPMARMPSVERLRLAA
jgi:uncharacterized protein YndB with AHSA1/START domain